ncbi:MAG: HU family DNA-binding protein [Bacteroidia bacterium]|nr:HU family DNA-binding protein [Bacteroidia bacterium]
MAKAAPKAMTKKEIIDHLSTKLDVQKKVAEQFLFEFTDLVYKQTKKQSEFTLPGLGKFVTGKTKARTGRNPSTGETIKIPAKKVLKFRVAKAAKDSVLGK